jgi:cyanophycin synthetase
VLEHVAIELQNVAGEDVTFGKTRSIDGTPGVYSVVYEYAQREEGIEAGELAMRLLDSLLPLELRTTGLLPEDWDWPTRATSSSATRSAARWVRRPPRSVHAAEARDIPWMRLNNQSLVQLGYGKYQQRIQGHDHGKTSHIAVELASDKEETNKILGSLGLPVPKQELVQSADGARRAARRIGFPVVTKPYNGNHGAAFPSAWRRKTRSPPASSARANIRAR